MRRNFYCSTDRTYICFPENISRCCCGGIPSFSSTLSFILSTLSVGSMSISISLPVRVCKIQKEIIKMNLTKKIIYTFTLISILLEYWNNVVSSKLRVNRSVYIRSSVYCWKIMKLINIFLSGKCSRAAQWYQPNFQVEKIDMSRSFHHDA